MLSAKAEHIANEAKKKGLWLYDPTYKKWYSPEEFKHAFTYTKTEDKF